MTGGVNNVVGPCSCFFGDFIASRTKQNKMNETPKEAESVV